MSIKWNNKVLKFLVMKFLVPQQYLKISNFDFWNLNFIFGVWILGKKFSVLVVQVTIWSLNQTKDPRTGVQFNTYNTNLKFSIFSKILNNFVIWLCIVKHSE